MKISKWHRKLVAALLASGLLAPAAAQALDIPLGDPSFEQFVVPTTSPAAGYAYAGIVPVHYRPTSPWISRPGAGNFQDGGPHGSNWIYNSAYAEGASTLRKRPAPRTGDQAMHGRGMVSGQKLTEVFEAGATYTFSVYAQGDTDAQIFQSVGWNSRVFLHIYDASLYGNDIGPNGEDFEVEGEIALTYDDDEYNPLSPDFTFFPHDRFAPDEPVPPDGATIHPGDFINRPAAATAEQSRAAWQQISVSWLVLPGAPEAGKPIGVAFQLFEDGAVDDAALIVLGPGDLNGDVQIDAVDWNILRSNQLADLSSMPPTDSYYLGDLNGDGQNNHADFRLFKTSFDDANGAGSFAAMIASVPEPATATLVLFVAAGLLVRRGKPSPS
jgi:hypothetical protein